MGRRVASSVVLGPVVLGAVWLGGPWLAVLVLAGAVAMATEWSRVTSGQAGVLLATGAVLASAAPLAGGAWPAALLCLGGVALAGVEAARRRPAWVWPLIGWVYVSLPCMSLIWLRSRPDGQIVALWLMLAVWATDIGAYFAGRTIGGPKLAPRVSPNKTWAGLVGGILAAALVGLGMARLAPGPSTGVLIAAGTVLAVVSQAGDLVESAWKRHFGVKDSGTLIPGHGGVLDRVDGLLFATIGAAMMALFLGDRLWAWR